MWHEAGKKITWKVKTFEEDCNGIEGVVHLRKQSRLECEDDDSVLGMVCDGEEEKMKNQRRCYKVASLLVFSFERL